MGRQEAVRTRTGPAPLYMYTSFLYETQTFFSLIQSVVPAVASWTCPCTSRPLRGESGVGSCRFSASPYVGPQRPTQRGARSKARVLRKGAGAAGEGRGGTPLPDHLSLRFLVPGLARCVSRGLGNLFVGVLMAGGVCPSSDVRHLQLFGGIRSRASHVLGMRIYRGVLAWGHGIRRRVLCLKSRLKGRGEPCGHSWTLSWGPLLVRVDRTLSEALRHRPRLSVLCYPDRGAVACAGRGHRSMPPCIPRTPSTASMRSRRENGYSITERAVKKNHSP